MACVAVARLHRVLHAAVQMVLEQLEPERVERRLHGRHLRQDVDAVAVLVDHAADAAHLALDAVHALGQRILPGVARGTVAPPDEIERRAACLARHGPASRDVIARILDARLQLRRRSCAPDRT